MDDTKDSSPFSADHLDELLDHDDSAVPAASTDNRVVTPSDEPIAINRLKYSTTSSVYAEHNLSNPNNDQVIYCIGAVMQAQIFDDFESPNALKNVFPEFNLQIPLSPEYGGPLERIPDHILNHETLHDDELRNKLLMGVVPTVDSVYRFISLISFRANFSTQCNIIALVYLNRITGRNGFALTMENWRGLWTSCIILAQKVWDDKPLRTSSFTQILPNVSKDQLRELEMKAFQMMDYTATVKPSIYAKYYFELRALFGEITKNDPRYQWNLKPLTLVQGMRLEDRSYRAGNGFRSASKSSSNSSETKGAKHVSPSSSGSPGSSYGQAKDVCAKTLEDLTYTPTTSRYVLRL